MLSFNIAAGLLAFVNVVRGHGGGLDYYINGVKHMGNYFGIPNTEGSIQRLWKWDYLADKVDSPLMTCGYPATVHPKSYHAPIVAGSTIGINYTFVHDAGPLLAYMAACPDEGCEALDIYQPIWFKVWEAGLLSGTWPYGHWAMSDVKKTGWLDIPTPASLKPGKYLLRHETMVLEVGPVQWFANCIQLDVSGPGTSVPADEELVAIPGAYDDDEDVSFAIKLGTNWFYNIHVNDTVYPMPGPPMAKLVTEK